jgi:hypothetical protein
MAGTYEIGAAVDGVDGAHTLDLTIATFSATMSAPAAANYNDIEFCGFDDWEADVVKDLTGVECVVGEEDTDTLPTQPGDKMYDIVLVADGGETLTTGDTDEGEGDTEENRPTEIDDEIVWTKE